jgi:hypothetical protein
MKGDAATEALQHAGQPLVRIAIADPYDRGQEFFRWEMATAVASSMLGVNALPVSGRKFTFGTVKAAQARGDFEVLTQRKRRVLRVHLGPDVPAGLAALHQAVRQALS